MEQYNHILDTMAPITLKEMKAVRLMNRVDDKYLLNRGQLMELLERIAPNYYVQRIDGEALAPYHTLYFDTDELAMYTAHHNRKLNRQKLRVRCYRSNQTTFFEIKNKNNKGKTNKIRIPIATELFDKCLSVAEVREFLQKESPYPIDSLGELVPAHNSCRQRDARAGDDRQRDTLPKPHERHRLRPLATGGDGGETRSRRPFDSHRPRLDGYEDSPETDEQILHRDSADRPERENKPIQGQTEVY